MRKTSAISAKVEFVRAAGGQFRQWWRSFVFGAGRRFDFLQNFEDARAALDRIVEMKNEMRRVFQDDVSRQVGLERGSIRFQLREHFLRPFEPSTLM